MIPDILLCNAAMGYGRTSMGGAVPILTGMGLRAVTVPTAFVSTPTGGFYGKVFSQDGYAVLDGFLSHFDRIGLTFAAAASGYIPGARTADRIREYFSGLTCPRLADPVFADHGQLYGGFGPEQIAALRRLIRTSDVITPNLTESAFLLGRPMPAPFTPASAREWMLRLQELGAARPVVTSASMEGRRDELVTLVLDENTLYSIRVPKIPFSCYGTGDALAALVTGSLARGVPLPEAVLAGTDFIQDGITRAVQAGRPPQEGMPLEGMLDRLSDPPRSQFSLEIL